MTSLASVAWTRSAVDDGDDELNDYESEESEYECDGEGGGGSGAESECDSEALEDELARAAFADVVSSNSSLEDEKLLDLLQRRLFSSSAVVSRDSCQRIVDHSTRSVAKRAAAPASSPPSHRWLHDDVRDLPIFSLADASTISPEKVGRMVRRFRLQEEKRAHKLRVQREAAEHSGHSFAPALNRKSLQMTHRMPAFLARQQKHLLRQQQQRERHEQAQEHERALALEEHVRTPCICSRGGSAVAPTTSPSRVGGLSQTPLSSGSAQQTHTRACLRFMEMCGTMNASFAIQRRKHEMRRSIDDMLAFHAEKQQRQRARSEIARAQEAMAAPFAPQINRRSEQIYAEMVRSGRLQSVLSERANAPAPPSVPTPSFRPSISKKSIALLRRRKKSLSAPPPTRAGEQESAAETGDADVFRRLHSEQLPRGDGEPRVLQSSTRNKSAKQPSEWNEVAYDDTKHSFILRSFDLKLFGA